MCTYVHYMMRQHDFHLMFVNVFIDCDNKGLTEYYECDSHGTVVCSHTVDKEQEKDPSVSQESEYETSGLIVFTCTRHVM